MQAGHLPIVITDRAREEVVNILSNKNIPKGYGLRIGVRGGGCAGVTYVIGFDKAKNSDDVFSAGQFEVLIEKKHLMYLLGLKVDFVDSDIERGFLFTQQEENG
jgi:iron-sulfur cluster assembly protein